MRVSIHIGHRSDITLGLERAGTVEEEVLDDGSACNAPEHTYLGRTFHNHVPYRMAVAVEASHVGVVQSADRLHRLAIEIKVNRE